MVKQQAYHTLPSDDMPIVYCQLGGEGACCEGSTCGFYEKHWPSEIKEEPSTKKDISKKVKLI